MVVERVGGCEAGQFSHDPLRPTTIARYVESFSPAPPWDDLPAWPPDVFALTNLVLDHTEAYRFAVAPRADRRWPPSPDWNERVVSAARAWRQTASVPGTPPPPMVLDLWSAVTRCMDTPMSVVRDGDDWPLCEALLTLHAMADEACAGLARSGEPIATRVFEDRAWALLGSHGSLSRFSSARIGVLPKTHFAGRGITIRSFSRYLALSYEAVDVQWQRMQPWVRWPRSGVDRRDFNIVLVPWPLSVRATDFRVVKGPLDNMDESTFGFFEFSPDERLPLDHLDQILSAAHRIVRRIDIVIFPEGAIDASEVAPLEDLLDAHSVISLIAGVRERATCGVFGGNRLHVGMRQADGWHHFDQAKHHRWCLDGPQIRQYHLTRVLDPDKQWWEAIDLPERRIQLLDAGGGPIAAPLICEDLARLDEVADVLRRVGPSLVVAVLLDGPQLITRWPCRYASILVDDPGSAVLTLTSLGMAMRSRPKGSKPSRVIAMWNDATCGARELAPGRGATALLITTSVGTKTVWTADGRRHDGTTPDLALAAVHPLTVGRDRHAAGGSI